MSKRKIFGTRIMVDPKTLLAQSCYNCTNAIGTKKNSCVLLADGAPVSAKSQVVAWYAKALAAKELVHVCPQWVSNVGQSGKGKS